MHSLNNINLDDEEERYTISSPKEVLFDAEHMLEMEIDAMYKTIHRQFAERLTYSILRIRKSIHQVSSQSR